MEVSKQPPLTSGGEERGSSPASAGMIAGMEVSNPDVHQGVTSASTGTQDLPECIPPPCVRQIDCRNYEGLPSHSLPDSFSATSPGSERCYQGAYVRVDPLPAQQSTTHSPAAASMRGPANEPADTNTAFRVDPGFCAPVTGGRGISASVNTGRHLSQDGPGGSSELNAVADSEHVSNNADGIEEQQQRLHEHPQVGSTQTCGVGSWQVGSGVEKYLQWLDAIHTACSKLDDLCSKLDRSFPNATKDWEATSQGIQGARLLFHLYTDPYINKDVHHIQPNRTILPLQHPQPSTTAPPQPVVMDDTSNIHPRKRSRREPSAQSTSVQPNTGCMSQSAGPATGAMAGRQQPSGNVPYSQQTDRSPQSCNTSSDQASSMPQSGSAPCSVPAGVPVGQSPGDAEYEYLLDYPEQEAPDPDNPDDLKCDVAGVYWDKRSWIASWYEGGKRYYKSFSAKTHGFYRSKYWAIKVRLSKVQGHLLVGKSAKSRGAASSAGTASAGHVSGASGGGRAANASSGTFCTF